jgi:hypothetical protein
MDWSIRNRHPPGQDGATRWRTHDLELAVQFLSPATQVGEPQTSFPTLAAETPPIVDHPQLTVSIARTE